MKTFFPATLILLLFTSFIPRERVWVAIGDSITYMNEHPEETDHRITKGYMTMVTEKLPHIKYHNQGHNGWTAGRIAESFDKLGIGEADIYSIFLGTNDWWAGRELGAMADYKENRGNGTVHGSFRIIIDKIKQLNPEAQIILIAPLQRGDFVYLKNPRNNAWGSYKPNKNGKTLESFVAALDSIAQHENIAFADLYHDSGINLRNMVKFKWLKDPSTGKPRAFSWPAWKDVPWNPESDEYPYPPEAIGMTYDGLHPSDKGYAAIAKMLVKAMK
ncbi:SGNH/GDSL hydrolase family protein [Chitinophaga sp.]|uniref:SGNH/GDSL hydrolase family protein n=1 Tax=Chitinophaga sp. TaxID=1869181 RepID=UPI002639AAB4|nr:SGNH/GDSL hydrolase family protein [uncultured Chitinophaga sp.]